VPWPVGDMSIELLDERVRVLHVVKLLLHAATGRDLDEFR
jgi:hypothetical protein